VKRKKMKKIGKFCVLIAAALLVTSVVVVLAQSGPAPYPTPPTPIEREPGVEVPIKPNGNPNSWYEEIAAIGFYPQERRLCAVILIKRPYDNGLYTDPGEDLGASYVPVTDPGWGVPQKLPLEYCVYKDIIPKAPVSSVVRVKAVLSWSTDPNYWGDIEYTWIRIDPIKGK
jgi:hypothetical protein